MIDMSFPRRGFLAGLLILFISQQGFSKRQMNNYPPPEMFKHWIHSREEDTGETRVYRPSNYKFPPSRGREGFELKENGEFIRYRIGPTDRPQKIVGTWKVEKGNHLRVTFEGQKRESYIMQFVSCDEQVLKVRLGKVEL